MTIIAFGQWTKHDSLLSTIQTTCTWWKVWAELSLLCTFAIIRMIAGIFSGAHINMVPGDLQGKLRSLCGPISTATLDRLVRWVLDIVMILLILGWTSGTGSRLSVTVCFSLCTFFFSWTNIIAQQLLKELHMLFTCMRRSVNILGGSAFIFEMLIQSFMKNVFPPLGERGRTAMELSNQSTSMMLLGMVSVQAHSLQNWAVSPKLGQHNVVRTTHSADNNTFRRV
jgi:hypothetical protein